jgi:alkaline phosphatase D
MRAGTWLLAGAPVAYTSQSGGIGTLEGERPLVSHGLQIGDVVPGRALVWARADRESRLIVEWSRHEDFRETATVRGPHALPQTDGVARVDVTGLPADTPIFVRASFEALDARHVRGEPALGRFRTPPDRPRPIRCLWSGDTGGQGWGINLETGGMTCYEAMRLARPDFFIHCGDTIYADNPMRDEVGLPGGGVWRNAFLDQEPARRRVAQTLDEFRACYRYNLLDAHVRRFNAEVPQVWLWDDHEVTNNWSDSKDLPADTRYSVSEVRTLAARGTRAFLEYAPMRPHTADDAERIYRRIPYGPDLDVFVLDMRSHRGPNTSNSQDQRGPETALFGDAQLAWLKAELAASRATWKVMAAGMPLGLIVGDGTDAEGRARFEGIANADGPPLGRELEVADLLRFIRDEGVRTVVWVTADVHYCAAHHYHPDRAVFRDFDPFWEFVSGPLHAGTFGPNRLDATFGPEVVFAKTPAPGEANLPPSAGLQFFGQLDIDPSSRAMTVSLKDASGAALFVHRMTSQ